MGKSKFNLLIYAVLIGLLLFGLIRLMLGFGGNYFRLELIGFMFLLLLSLVGFISYTRAWGERVLFFVFWFYLVNEVLIWYVSGIVSWILLFLSVAGFLMSIPKKEEKSYVVHAPKKEEAVEAHSQVFDSKAESSSEFKEGSSKNADGNEAVETKSVKHVPGKYVASKQSNVYHEPKCDWAKKIKKNRQVWFESKEDAWEKGYKSHSCVE